MQKDEIRLECLKLACRAGLSPDEILANARVFVAWVDGIPTPTTPQRPGDSSKVSKPAPSVPDRTSPPKQQSVAKAAP